MKTLKLCLLIVMAIAMLSVSNANTISLPHARHGGPPPTPGYYTDPNNPNHVYYTESWQYSPLAEALYININESAACGSGGCTTYTQSWLYPNDKTSTDDYEFGYTTWAGATAAFCYYGGFKCWNTVPVVTGKFVTGEFSGIVIMNYFPCTNGGCDDTTEWQQTNTGVTYFQPFAYGFETYNGKSSLNGQITGVTAYDLNNNAYYFPSLYCTNGNCYSQ